MPSKTSGNIYINNKDAEEKALEEVQELEVKLSKSMTAVLETRRIAAEAMRELNEKYLLLGFEPISIVLKEGK